MNQFLPFNGRLIPKLKQLFPYVREITLIIALIVSVVSAQAQSNSVGQSNTNGNSKITGIQQLKTGDSIPNSLWNLPLEMLSDGVESKLVTLNPYRDKLIILDFWATWCVPCIKAFPKLNNLQSEFQDKIQILSVTDQESSTVLKTLNTNRYLKGNTIPIVVNDNIQYGLAGFFPKRMIPHVVVIKDDKVLIVTSGDAVTQKNIAKLINENTSGIPIKDDQVDFNRFKPLLIQGNGGSPGNFIFRSILTAPIAGVGSGYTRFSNVDEKQIGYKVINSNLKSAWSIIFPKLSQTPPNHVIFPEGFKELRDSTFCYEVIVPAVNTDKLKGFVQRDLITYFGLVGRWAPNEIACLVLKNKTDESGTQKSTLIPPEVFTDNLFAGQSTQYLVSRLNWSSSQLPPVVNDAKEALLPDNNPSFINNLKSLNAWLATAGLQLVTETRKINLFQFETP